MLNVYQEEHTIMNYKENKWTIKEEFALREMIANGKTKKEIAKELNRSEASVHLYCYRNKVPTKKMIPHSIVRKMLEIKFGKPEFFNPDRSFYVAVQMTSHRWQNLAFGYEKATQEECIRICKAINFNTEEMFKLLDARQLSLF